MIPSKHMRNKSSYNPSTKKEQQIIGKSGTNNFYSINKLDNIQSTVSNVAQHLNNISMNLLNKSNNKTQIRSSMKNPVKYQKNEILNNKNKIKIKFSDIFKIDFLSNNLIICNNESFCIKSNYNTDNEIMQENIRLKENIKFLLKQIKQFEKKGNNTLDSEEKENLELILDTKEKEIEEISKKYQQEIEKCSNIKYEYQKLKIKYKNLKNKFEKMLTKNNNQYFSLKTLNSEVNNHLGKKILFENSKINDNNYRKSLIYHRHIYSTELNNNFNTNEINQNKISIESYGKENKKRKILLPRKGKQFIPTTKQISFIYRKIPNISNSNNEVKLISKCFSTVNNLGKKHVINYQVWEKFKKNNSSKKANLAHIDNFEINHKTVENKKYNYYIPEKSETISSAEVSRFPLSELEYHIKRPLPQVDSAPNDLYHFPINLNNNINHDKNLIYKFNISSMKFDKIKYNLEKNSSFNNTFYSTKNHSNDIILSISNGFLFLTGENTNNFFFYNKNTNYIQDLCKLNHCHNKGALIKINDEQIMCISGMNSVYTEMYFIKDDIWFNLPKMNFAHSESSFLVYNKNIVFSFFGYNYNSFKYITNIVEFLVIKNYYSEDLWKKIYIKNYNYNLRFHSIFCRANKGNNNSNDIFIVGGYNQYGRNNVLIQVFIENKNQIEYKISFKKYEENKVKIKTKSGNLDNLFLFGNSFFQYFDEKNDTFYSYNHDNNFNIHIIDNNTLKHTIYRNKMKIN